MHFLLGQGEVFERALMNRVSLALVTYLLGNSCVLSGMSSTQKGPGGEKLVLHTDNVMVPSPFPAYAQVANSTLAVTDYSREEGSVLFWPGSHRFCRHPLPEEVADEDAFMPVEAPAGSLIVWHGNTWHGAYPRRAPGYRLNLIMFFCRMYMKQQEPIWDIATDAMRERWGERFCRLAGDHVPYPLEGLRYRKMYSANAAGKLLAG